MMKAEILAKERGAFVRKWKPDATAEIIGEFEEEVDRLIYAAFACAEEPFRIELENYEKRAMIAANPSLVPRR